MPQPLPSATDFYGAHIQLNAILETAVDAVILADSQGTILSWNKGAERLFGYRPVEVLNKPITILVSQSQKAAHEHGLDRVTKTGQTRIIGQTVEVIACRNSGEEFPVELSLSTWVTQEGRFYCGIIRDISRRKRNEARLQEANQKIMTQNKNLEDLSRNLSRYLSPQLYRRIFLEEKEVVLESKRKLLTVFFSDLVGFTDLTDRLEPEALSGLLNDYLDEMSRIALVYGGTIDKYMGDAIMIFFGDSDSLGKKADALACVRMALGMQERLQFLRKKWEDQGITAALRARMGINTGYCTVGNFGSVDRLDYTIIGGQVNLASRLEALAPPDGILIAEETYLSVKDTVQCTLGTMAQVKGIAHPVQTWHVVGLRSDTVIAEDRFRLALEDFITSEYMHRVAAPDRQRILAVMQTAMENACATCKATRGRFCKQERMKSLPDADLNAANVDD